MKNGSEIYRLICQPNGELTACYSNSFGVPMKLHQRIHQKRLLSGYCCSEFGLGAIHSYDESCYANYKWYENNEKKYDGVKLFWINCDPKDNIDDWLCVVDCIFPPAVSTEINSKQTHSLPLKEIQASSPTPTTDKTRHEKENMNFPAKIRHINLFKHLKNQQYHNKKG